MVAGIATALSMLGADCVRAQPIFDHLKCYKIADPLPGGITLADLVPEQDPPFTTELGCKIKRPAKLFCIDVEKTNVSPPPPSTVGGQTTRDFLCYPLKCPPLANMPLAVEDQFGPRTVLVKQPKVFCVPAIKAAYPQPTSTPCVQPTPTPTPTPTPAVPTPTATGTPCPKVCIAGPNIAAPCNNNSECPSSVCQSTPCCCALQTANPPCTVNADCIFVPGDYCSCP
jgi:hypothetical protein